MHKIFELRDMGMEQLQSLASELNIKGFKKMEKDDLVYAILDEEARHNAHNAPEKPAKPKRGRPKKGEAKVEAKAEAKAEAAAKAQLEETGKAPKTKAPAEKREARIYYRTPSICTVNVKNGVELLLQTRVPVYQLGQESSFPVNVILK